MFNHFTIEPAVTVLNVIMHKTCKQPFIEEDSPVKVSVNCLHADCVHVKCLFALKTRPDSP